MDVYFSNKDCNKFRKINLSNTKPVKGGDRPRSAMKVAEIDMKDRIAINFKGVNIPRVMANPNLFYVNLDTLCANNSSINLEYLDDYLQKNQRKRGDYSMVMDLANCKIADTTPAKPYPSVRQAKSPQPATNTPIAVSPPLTNGNVPFDPVLHSNWQGSQHPGRTNSQPSHSPQPMPTYGSRGSLPANTGYSIVDQFVNLTGVDQAKAAKYIQKHGTIEKAFTSYNHEKASINELMKRIRVSQSEAEFLLESSNFNMQDAARLFGQMRR